MQKRVSVCIVLVVLATLAAAPVWSQGAETYAVAHLYALPAATTARLFGMGGIVSCVQDVGFANPAFAGALDGPAAGLRYSVTDFDAGLKLTVESGWVTMPLAEGGQGIQLVGCHLSSDMGPVNTPSGALGGTISENNLAVHYGRRVGERWLFGLGLSPVSHTTTNLYNPLDGSLIAHLDSKADSGCRFGALYEYEPGSFAGLVYDRYTEDVNMTSVLLPAPMAVEFTSSCLFLGVSGQLNERTVGAIEWGEMRSKSGSMKTSTSGLRAGIEYAPTDELATRIGVNDGSPALGLGYCAKGWCANYAYLHDWNEDAVGAVLGGSDTHQIEAIVTW